ncbi:hypothetical protein B0H67DRAFT_686537 [Lasiosphaeris hirsuta]|uniref:Uncharacterized protein n=1 Tax=Lasiosphaeris hirsuta TaxID=260670 RepID=A0AA40A381_9PEZI|nr:hypothetical protein B0H67DRAFT_686537 [Lasiosphaeris hirsuta]
MESLSSGNYAPELEDWSEIAKSFELFRRLQLSNQTSIDYVITIPSGPTEIELTGAGDIQSLPQYQSKDELFFIYK